MDPLLIFVLALFGLWISIMLREILKGMKRSSTALLILIIYVSIIAIAICLVVGIVNFIGIKTASAIFAAFVTIVFVWVVYSTIRDAIKQHRGK